MTDTISGIERAVARSEITELVHRYAYMARENADFAGMAEMFTEDGKFILPNGVELPANEIHKIVNGQEPKYIRHMFTTIQIDFTGKDTAKAESLAIVYTDLAQPDHWGIMKDEFRRGEDGKWRVSRKQPTIEGFAPHGWVGTVLMPAMSDAKV